MTTNPWLHLFLIGYSCIEQIEIILCLILSIQWGSRLLLAHTLCDSFWNNIENIQKEVFTSNGHHWHLDYRKPKLVYFKVFWRYGPQLQFKKPFLSSYFLNKRQPNLTFSSMKTFLYKLDQTFSPKASGYLNIKIFSIIL